MHRTRDAQWQFSCTFVGPNSEEVL